MNVISTSADLHDTLQRRRIAAATLLLMLSACGSTPVAPPPPTVSSVDLNRYTGTWYELAKIPNRFQRQCAANTTARYTRQADGAIEVLNRCQTADGRYDQTQGIARVVDARSSAKLEVSFFSILGWRPVWGDYWILELDGNYEYALVGTPDRKFGWLLSRTPALPVATRAAIDRRLRQLGYDPAQFTTSPQRPDYSPSK
jgi:apolipoprotein D and lipocalin family protein